MAEITYLPIDRLREHPLNPRKDLGDLTELAESIKGNGILQNLTVVPIACVPKLTGRDYGVEDPKDNDLYVVVIGHRRLAAAKMAGEEDVPCTIATMSPAQQQETMLIENIQRSDLSPYEQAQGFQMMFDMGHSVATISSRTGFSETTVRRRLKMAELDPDKLREVSARQISLEDFDRLSQIEDLGTRNEALDKIGTRDFDAAVQKAVKEQNITKHLPEVKAWLKSVKAKKIKDSDRWSNKYDRIGSTIYVEKWGEDGNKPKESVTDKPVFYRLSEAGYDRGQLELYHEHEKAPPVKKTQEEIDRAKAVREARARLESAAALAYDLRKKFVEGLAVTKKNEKLVLLGALYAAGYNVLAYNSGTDQNTIAGICGIEGQEYYHIPVREEKYFNTMQNFPYDDLPKFIYATIGDSEKETFAESYSKDFPKYRRNVKMELIYHWLASLGYELSTEEQQMLSGEHEVFKAGEAYADV